MLILSSLIVLGTNLYYNFADLIISDGRWKTIVSVTGLFVIVYLILFGLVSKKFLAERNYYFMIVFSIILSIFFLTLQPAISRAFQDNRAFYVAGYVLTAPYLIVLGIGIVAYITLVLFIERLRVKNKV